MLEKKYTFMGKMARGIIPKNVWRFEIKIRQKRESQEKESIMCTVYKKYMRNCAKCCWLRRSAETVERGNEFV